MMTASFIQSIQSNIVLWRDQTACKKRRIWLVTKQGLPSVCLRGWQRLDWKPIKQSNNKNQTASSLGMSAHHQIIIIIIVNELLGRFRLKRRNRCTAPPLLRWNQLPTTTKSIKGSTREQLSVSVVLYGTRPLP